MIRIDLLHKQKIKWEGITDFPEFYKYLKLWLQDNGYAKERSLEKKYIERAKPEGKKQVEIAWESKKSKSEFFDYHIDMTILILNMSDIEVQQEDGSKRKMQKGTFEVRVSSYITSTEKWNQLKGLQKLYLDFFIRKRIDLYLEELYKKSTSFHSYVKSLLGLRD
ncbi:hypothetical protein J4446_00750 [Candidatus Woesearchaeota archaeon]|nr:hypothetical protein [Candidatus Woesearchaeota archaeon]